MKLDKIRFATLIAFIGQIGGKIGHGDIEAIDTLIDIDTPVSPAVANKAMVDELVQAVATMVDKHEGMIPAIKAYRALTNATLIDAKTAIEKYRNYDEKLSKNELIEKLKAENINNVDYNIVFNFIGGCFKPVY